MTLDQSPIKLCVYNKDSMFWLRPIVCMSVAAEGLVIAPGHVC